MEGDVGAGGASCGEARERLGPVTVVVHGSVVRGDFNRWSDVDVVLVSRFFEGMGVLERLGVVEEIRPPGVEVVPLAPGEFLASLSPPGCLEEGFRAGLCCRVE